MSNIFKFYINNYNSDTQENVLSDVYLFIKSKIYQFAGTTDVNMEHLNIEYLNKKFSTLEIYEY